VIYYTINNLRRSFTNWLLNDVEFERKAVEKGRRCITRCDTERGGVWVERANAAVKEELK
jgi:hypothetical protein